MTDRRRGFAFYGLCIVITLASLLIPVVVDPMFWQVDAFNQFQKLSQQFISGLAYLLAAIVALPIYRALPRKARVADTLGLTAKLCFIYGAISLLPFVLWYLLPLGWISSVSFVAKLLWVALAAYFIINLRAPSRSLGNTLAWSLITVVLFATAMYLDHLDDRHNLRFTDSTMIMPPILGHAGPSVSLEQYLKDIEKMQAE